MRTKAAADILDVARVAGVSPATVSRAFNHPDLVRADTRDRVRRAVDQLGYIRNRAASTIHGARSGAVGLIVPTIDNAIFAQLIQAFSTALQEAGQNLLIATHGYDLAEEHTLLRKLLEQRVDGVGLIGVAHQDRTYDLLKTRGAPAVLLWSFDEGAALPCVGSDNREAGALAARHILALGHRRIATVFPPMEGNDRAAERYRGAIDACEAAGAAPPPAWRRTSRYHLGEAKTAAARLLAQADRPTAVIAGNDVIARGVTVAASGLGLRTPEDLSVIGIGDFTGSGDLAPALTTVRIDAARVGREAAEMLLGAMTGAKPGDGTGGRRKIPLKLMERETTAPPPV